MSTVAYTARDSKFTTALVEASTRAIAAYPTEKARIHRGLEIAVADGVTLHDDGSATVQSQHTPGVTYHVNGACPCKDALVAPHGRCKHKYARWLVKAALADVRRHAGKDRWYATYWNPAGEAIPGIAEWCHKKQCWLFIPEDGSETLFPAIQALCLGGNIALIEEQHEKDGDLVRKVCGY